MLAFVARRLLKSGIKIVPRSASVAADLVEDSILPIGCFDKKKRKGKR